MSYNNNNSKVPPIHDDNYPNIYNLAQAHLNTHEKMILDKGLKFCPTPKATSSI